MITETCLIDYLKKEEPQVAIEILRENSLYHIFIEKFKDTSKEDKMQMQENIALNILNKHTLDNIVHIFEENAVEYIVFKGLALSYFLYEKYTVREVGDIDIYVNESKFSTALNLLLQNGFILKNKETLNDMHHVVLIKENVLIELHRHLFETRFGINETYMISHTIKKNGWVTFDVTATFLQLIYHLYVDNYLAYEWYLLITKQMPPKVKRFLYRAYELVLFAEKYRENIKWEDIIRELKAQKLRVLFKSMFEKILRIFPNSFPETFIESVMNRDYVIEKQDYVYWEIFGNECNFESEWIKKALSRYVEEKWNPDGKALTVYMEKQVQIQEEVSLNSNRCLDCKFNICKNDGDMILTFDVFDDDFYVSDIDNYILSKSDGIQLYLCGTQEYSYLNVSLLPKIIGESIKVIIYDVLNRSVVNDEKIVASINKNDERYELQVRLSEQMIAEMQIEEIFYINFLVSDCNSKTGNRRRYLSLSNTNEEWFNPLYFAKVICR